MKVPFALSAAPSVVLGLPAKLNKNVYAERHESDPDRPWVLLETPGTKVWEAFDDGLRGIWQTDGHAGGKILIAAGDTIELFDPATNALASPMTGTIAGTDKGDLAFTEAEGFGLFNGQLYVSSGTAIAAVTDPDFAALLAFAGVSSFSSVTTIGQRGIFSFGSQFGFTEVSDLDNTTALSYYTPESSPDAIVAVKALGEYVYVFGTKTIEPWTLTGDSSDPLAVQSGMIQQIGCACRDGIVEADNALFFVDNTFNARRLAAGASQVISPPWLAEELRQYGSENIFSMSYASRGHIFVGFWTLSGCHFYDVMTSAQRGEPVWHTRTSGSSLTWAVLLLVMVGPAQNARVFGRAIFNRFVELSDEFLEDFEEDPVSDTIAISREFSAALTAIPDRVAITSAFLEGAKGIGTPTGQGENPQVEMCFSKDNGQTWSAWEARPLGAQGAYSTESAWRRLGRVGRQGIIFWFRKTDPVRGAYTGVRVNE